MIGDVFTLVSNAQAVTAAGQVSTSSIDLLANKDIAAGQTVEAVITCSVSAAGTSVNLNFNVITTDNNDLTGNVTVIGTATVAKASVVAGCLPIIIRLNPAQAGMQSVGRRYLGIRYDGDGGTFTAGTFTAKFVLPEADTGGLKAYPSGFPNPAT